MDKQVNLPRPAIICIAGIAIAAFAVSMVVPAAFPGENIWLGLPMAVVALLWLVPLFMALLRGERWAFMLALAVLIFLTDSSFRARHWADKSLDWQVLLKGTVWAGLGLVGLIRLGRTGFMLQTAPGFCTVLFLLMLAASAGWSPMPLYTAQSAIAFFCMLLFGLAAAQILDERRLLVAIALGYGLIVLPSLAIAPFAMGLTPTSPGSTGEVGRLRGLTDHPIPLAETAALFTFAVGALAFRARRVAARLGFLILVAAGVATVLLTQSRIPPISMLAAICGFAAYRKGGWLLMVPTITLFVGLVMLLESIGGFAAMLPRDVLELVSRSGSSHEILSLSGRLDIWPYVLDRIAQSPLVGHGHASGMMLLKGFTRWRITHAHNLYLQALLYVGAIGFALLMAAFLAQLKVFLRDPRPVRDILLLYTLLKGATEQSVLSNMPSGSVALWMVTVGMAALAWRPKARRYVALGATRPSAP